jgi:flavin reductase (DIM6/NTAB) family NADH-FMN oxidoreductase RutF
LEKQPDPFEGRQNYQRAAGTVVSQPLMSHLMTIDAVIQIDADHVKPAHLYQHLLRIIVPRPIAWVSTQSTDGISNLAPFSFFSGVGVNPPSLLFCPSNRRDGSEKDTLRNIRQTEEFVVNAVPDQLSSSMNATAAELPDDESEFSRFGIAATASRIVRPPGVSGSPVHIECRLLKVVSLATGPGAANIVIGRIVTILINERVLDESGLADPAKLALVGRMGGSSFCRTQVRFDLPRQD